MCRFSLRLGGISIPSSFFICLPQQTQQAYGVEPQKTFWISTLAMTVGLFFFLLLSAVNPATKLTEPGVYSITYLKSWWACWSDRALITLETDDIDLRMNNVEGPKESLRRREALGCKKLYSRWCFGISGWFLARLPPSQAVLVARVNLWLLPFPGWGSCQNLACVQR